MLDEEPSIVSAAALPEASLVLLGRLSAEGRDAVFAGIVIPPEEEVPTAVVKPAPFGIMWGAGGAAEAEDA